MTRDFADLARWLVAEHAAKAQARRFAGEYAIHDLPAAYKAQAVYVELMCGRTGTRPAGYKIGLTSVRMQRMCGIDQPLAGVVLADRIHHSGKVIRVADHTHLGIESEIAIRLGRDLPAAGGPYDEDAVAAAVDAVAPAFEMVEDRNADYRILDPLSLVADNSWNAGIVVGAFRADWPDLAAISGVLMRDGAELDRGAGHDVLGHPFVPLHWIANHLCAMGGGLRKGDIVMTGAVVPTKFAAPGQHYRFDLAGLGSVELTTI